MIGRKKLGPSLRRRILPPCNCPLISSPELFATKEPSLSKRQNTTMTPRVITVCVGVMLLVAVSNASTQGCGGLLDSVLNQLQTMSTQISELQNENSQQQSELTALKSQSQKSAAFSARLGGGTINDLNIGNEPIRFPNVVTNIGNGYDPATGIFTAPYSGVYTFYFHMRSTNTHSWLVVRIFKNEEELMAATADGSDNHWNRGSVWVTTHANAGDRFYCQQSAGSTWLEGGELTQFSGALVHAD
jgi:hypothetical protein